MWVRTEKKRAGWIGTIGRDWVVCITVALHKSLTWSIASRSEMYRVGEEVKSGVLGCVSAKSWHSSQFFHPSSLILTLLLLQEQSSLSSSTKHKEYHPIRHRSRVCLEFQLSALHHSCMIPQSISFAYLHSLPKNGEGETNPAQVCAFTCFSSGVETSARCSALCLYRSICNQVRPDLTSAQDRKALYERTFDTPSHKATHH